MMFKNTFRLLFSNFHIVWKILLYMLLVLVTTAFIAYFACLPIVNQLMRGGFFDGVGVAYNSFLTNTNIAQLFESISQLTTLFVDIIASNIASLLFYIILFFSTTILFFEFFKNMYTFAVSNYLYMFMSNGVTCSFSKSFFENFGKNVRYQLLNLITVLPLKLLVLYLVFLSFKLFAVGGVLTFFAPFISIFVYTLLTALIVTAFSCWVPTIVSKDYSVIKSLRVGFSVMTKRFIKTFSNAICLVLTVIFLNVFVGIFTFGVALLVTIPVCSMLYASFNMVSFYTSSGMRFYIDTNSVIAPKRMELTDSLSHLKYII